MSWEGIIEKFENIQRDLDKQDVEIEKVLAGYKGITSYVDEMQKKFEQDRRWQEAHYARSKEG